MPDEAIWVWIDVAVKEYGRSRAWLDEQVRHGFIEYQKFPGDRRTYLKRTDVEKAVGQSSPSRMRPPRRDDEVG